MIPSKLKIISQIQNVRSKNNKYWMDVLRLAFKLAPDKASALMKKINLNDQKISKLVKKLSNKNT
jgi:predicted transcriptional regulator